MRPRAVAAKSPGSRQGLERFRLWNRLKMHTLCIYECCICIATGRAAAKGPAAVLPSRLRHGCRHRCPAAGPGRGHGAGHLAAQARAGLSAAVATGGAAALAVNGAAGLGPAAHRADRLPGTELLLGTEVAAGRPQVARRRRPQAAGDLRAPGRAAARTRAPGRRGGRRGVRLGLGGHHLPRAAGGGRGDLLFLLARSRTLRR